jgi:hypothetical protein
MIRKLGVEIQAPGWPTVYSYSQFCVRDRLKSVNCWPVLLSYSYFIVQNNAYCLIFKNVLRKKVFT